MKYLKAALIGLAIIIVAAIGLITYQYNTFKPREVTHKIDSDNLNYFHLEKRF